MTYEQKRKELNQYAIELMSEHGLNNERITGRIGHYDLIKLDINKVDKFSAIYGRLNGKKYNLHLDISKDIAELYSSVENYFDRLKLLINHKTEQRGNYLIATK